jgi:hypothetical protein
MHVDIIHYITQLVVDQGGTSKFILIRLQGRSGKAISFLELVAWAGRDALVVNALWMFKDGVIILL